MYSARRQELFWSHVDRTGLCWEWTGCVTGIGYGLFSVKRSGEWARVQVHRYSWGLHNDPSDLETGAWVLHHCDNRVCVNPAHLYLGDAQQNANDAMNRDRLHTKLTPDQVVELRELRSSGEGIEVLASRFGVTSGAVSGICRGRSRRSCGGPTHPSWAFRCKETRKRKRKESR